MPQNPPVAKNSIFAYEKVAKYGLSLVSFWRLSAPRCSFCGKTGVSFFKSESSKDEQSPRDVFRPKLAADSLALLFWVGC